MTEKQVEPKVVERGLPLKVEKVVVQSFRSLKSFSMDFDPKVTAIIGANGAGKSSVLYGLEWFFKGKTTKTAIDKTVEEEGRVLPPKEVEVSFVDLPPEFEEADSQYVFDAKLTIKRSELQSGFLYKNNQGLYVPDKSSKLAKLLAQKIDYLLIPGSLHAGDLEVEPTSRSPLNQLIQSLLGPAESWFSFNEEARERANRQLTAKLEATVWPEISRFLPDGHQMEGSAEYEVPEPKLVLAPSIHGVPLEQQSDGLQRSIMLSILQASQELQHRGKALILGVEEPELYQHPVKARHVAKVLNDWAESDDNQMVYVTHHPAFVSPRHFDSVRRLYLVRGQGTHIASTTVSQIQAENKGMVKGQALSNFLEKELPKAFADTFFSNGAVLVEGDTDLSIFQELLLNAGMSLDAAGISILSVGGVDNLVFAKSILEGLDIPCFTILDLDQHVDGAKSNFAKKVWTVGLPTKAEWKTIGTFVGNHGVAFAHDLESELAQEPWFVNQWWPLDNKDRIERHKEHLKAAGKSSEQAQARLQMLLKESKTPPSGLDLLQRLRDCKDAYLYRTAMQATPASKLKNPKLIQAVEALRAFVASCNSPL